MAALKGSIKALGVLVHKIAALRLHGHGVLATEPDKDFGEVHIKVQPSGTV